MCNCIKVEDILVGLEGIVAVTDPSRESHAGHLATPEGPRPQAISLSGTVKQDEYLHVHLCAVWLSSSRVYRSFSHTLS